MAAGEWVLTFSGAVGEGWGLGREIFQWEISLRHAIDICLSRINVLCFWKVLVIFPAMSYFLSCL